MIDEYFDFKLGHLEYRTVRFETEVLDTDNYQGNAVVNYTEREVPYTRIIEHKHFEFGNQPKTVISKEYSSEWKPGIEPYYPINDETNGKLFEQYKELADKEENVIFGGRLGNYKYYDMEDQLRKSTQSLGTAMGSLNQVKKQLENAQEQSANWQGKAKTCLEQGNEDLARQALENKVKQDNMVAQYQEMVTSMETQVNEIKNQVDILKQKLEEARSKQAMLVARSQMADAKSQMAKTLGNMDSKSAFAKMDKMEKKIEQKESQADAFAEVSGVQESESDPFAQMDKENSINAELEKLKKEMGNS